MAIEIDLKPLFKAAERLREGLLRHQRESGDAQVRDGLIQRFEFTYELSHKMLKRYLEKASPTPQEFDEMAFPDLIRSANEQGLLMGSWENWKVYRSMRGRTSHTYNEDIAMEVVEGIPGFLEEAEFLRDRLAERTQ